MSRLEDKKARRSKASRGQDKTATSAPRVSPQGIPDNGEVISTHENAVANKDSVVPKRRKSRRRSEHRKSSQPRRRSSQKSISENATDNDIESFVTDGAVCRKTCRRSSATKKSAHKKQDRSRPTSKSLNEQTSKRRSIASSESGGATRTSGLRRPSLLVRSPSLSRSSFEPSVSSRGSSNSRCSSHGVLQFDPTKSDHFVKRRKDDSKRSYAVATVQGTTFEGSIANLVLSPEKAQVAIKSDDDPDAEEDPFALLDLESKMEDDTILHQSVLSLTISAGSSLTGFSDGEDAFSDFDPMDFPDHNLHDTTVDGIIIPDYVESVESSQHHNNSRTRNASDKAIASVPAATGIGDRDTTQVMHQDACHRRLGSAFRRRSESRKRMHQSFPTISVGKADHEDQASAAMNTRSHSSMKLADSSASFIALMQTDNEDDDSEGEENEMSRLGKSLLLLSLDEQSKHRPAEILGGCSKSNEVNRGLGRSFSLKGILRRGFKKGESNISDDASVGSAASSVRNLFQSRCKQHSLLED